MPAMKSALALPLLVLLAACSSHTAWQVSAGTPKPDLAGQVQVTSSPGLAALLGVAILAGGVYEVSRSGFAFGGSARPPEMAPDRKISEQDCSKPLDYSPGNIRCK
jgi:hypothetical protein